MQHPTDRIAHTTAFVTPFVDHWLEREIAQWVYPMKDRSDDPSHHERTLLPRIYISLLKSERFQTRNTNYIIMVVLMEHAYISFAYTEKKHLVVHLIPTIKKMSTAK